MISILILLLIFYYQYLLVGCVSNSIKYYLKTASIQKPAYWKEGSKGEDALFVLNNDIGVFDGVGAWLETGIDSGQYSRELAKSIRNFIKQKRLNGQVEIDLLRSLIYGYESNLFRNVSGSTTVCIASMNSLSGKLSVLNLGDSGLIIFRMHDETSTTSNILSLAGTNGNSIFGSVPTTNAPINNQNVGYQYLPSI